METEDVFFIGTGALFAGLVVTALYLGHQEVLEKTQILTACMKDHKEYECHSMLDNHQSTVPVFIPMIMPGR